MVALEAPLISIVCDSEGLLWIKFNLVSWAKYLLYICSSEFSEGEKGITLEGLVVLQPMHCSGPNVKHSHALGHGFQLGSC